MRKLGLALLAAAVASPALADCDHLKWSVAAERAAFVKPALLPSVSGSAEVGTAYLVSLEKDASFPQPPERAPAKGAFGAVVNLPNLVAGRYQVTLSEEGWVDVVQDGALVKSSAFSGQRDCPGIRKSVRFDLADGPATVQISNVGADKIILEAAPAK